MGATTVNRFSLYLPDEERAEIERWAKRDGVSLALFLRIAAKERGVEGRRLSDVLGSEMSARIKAAVDLGDAASVEAFVHEAMARHLYGLPRRVAIRRATPKPKGGA